MARLAKLKLSMFTSTFLVFFIFTLFLVAIMYLFQLPLIFAVIGSLLFILFQYLIGPEIVKASTRLRYLKPGENPWLESTIKELAEKVEFQCLSLR